MISTEHCSICNASNRTLYWHQDSETGDIWCWCNKCERGRGVWQYCNEAGISLVEFLKGDFDFKEAQPNEVTRIDWPQVFVPLADPRAKAGVEYLAKRGLTTVGEMYYDIHDKGIVFPYHFDSVFCGAQVRFLKNRINKDGDIWKITTLPGTRLGLVIYGYNQTNIMPHVKGFIVTEGALNALSIQQSLDKMYGGTYKSPFKVVACSGSGFSNHHAEVFNELIERGYKVVIASDSDAAGLRMMEKAVKNKSATHFALTDTEADWNDELVRLGGQVFAKYFLDRVEKINYD